MINSYDVKLSAIAFPKILVQGSYSYSCMNYFLSLLPKEKKELVFLSEL